MAARTVSGEQRVAPAAAPSAVAVIWPLAVAATKVYFHLTLVAGMQAGADGCGDGATVGFVVGVGLGEAVGDGDEVGAGEVVGDGDEVGDGEDVGDGEPYGSLDVTAPALEMPTAESPIARTIAVTAARDFFTFYSWVGRCNVCTPAGGQVAVTPSHGEAGA